MTQTFLTVTDKAGRPVSAKTLVDAYGYDVINPRTGQPYIVPIDYELCLLDELSGCGQLC